MTKRFVVCSMLMIATCGLVGCDTFRVVHLAPHYDTGTKLATSKATDVDELADAVRKVAAQNQLTCKDHPTPDVFLACGPWFHSLSVMQAGGTPTIELNLAHPGWDFGHDRDCDQIDEWIRDLQALLGEMNISPSNRTCH